MTTTPELTQADLEEREFQALWEEDEIERNQLLANTAFEIMDDEQADWVANSLQRMEDEIQRREATHALIIARLKRKKELFQRRFSLKLEDYLLCKLAQQGGKKKSVLLPCGVTLAHRINKGNLKIRDEETYKQWVRENLPEAIETEQVEKFSKTVVNEYFEKVRQLPEGCEWVPEHEGFHITLPKKEK